MNLKLIARRRLKQLPLSFNRASNCLVVVCPQHNRPSLSCPFELKNGKIVEQVLQSSKKWKITETETSPERNRVWIELVVARRRRMMKKVSVVYYLSRNGHLEHPHFMEVPLSCPDGLYLKDVISRFNLLRGTAMASLYSWSSKRSYKHGFVWHDLCEEDYIHPVHSLEYILKGSEILFGQAMIHSSVKKSPEDWSSSVAADASTQTDDKKLCGRLVAENNQIVELDGSPPPMDSNSSSSPETLEALMKSDKRLTSVSTNTSDQDASQSGRLKASSVLMQLITCGSFSFRDCGATAVKDHGMRLISEYREDDQVKRKMEGLVENHSSFERVSLEDKEYFSGSVIETQRKEEFLTLNRSSSYNADRVSKTPLELAEKKRINKNTKEEPNGVVRRIDAANFNSQ